MVDVFGVDGIPHVAFISKAAEVKTALVGAVPAPLMNMEVEAFVKVMHSSAQLLTYLENFLVFSTNIDMDIFDNLRCIRSSHFHWKDTTHSQVNQLISPLAKHLPCAP